MIHYLSRLVLNARHNRTQSELKHPYELHRTVCNAWDDPKSDRILFRSDWDSPGIVAVIVQSRTKPEWSRLKVPKDYLVQVDGPRRLDLQALAAGQAMRFRLRCHPSKRIGEKGREDFGKRRSLTTKDETFAWLDRKAKSGGFAVREVAFDRVYWYDSRGGIKEKPLGAVLFDGVLEVTDPVAFRNTLAAGVGPGKGLGFGLLSVAPARD